MLVRIISAFCLSFLALQAVADVHTAHAIAMHGTPKYAAGFDHFDYVNPAAPKGGRLKLAEQGSFDSLNPFIAKGNAASEVSLTIDSLMSHAADEPFSLYGLVAETISWPDERNWVEFTLRSSARFHDGTPITAEDVKYTFALLMEKGSPLYKTQYANVAEVKVLAADRIRFNFYNGDDRELVLLVAQLPVLSKAYWSQHDFTATTLDAPLGSGPYRITQVDAGKSIVLQRVDDYWGKDLAVNKGRFNFDTVRYDYYRDSTVMLEALKAGEYDFRRENVSKQWATGYTGEAIDKGWLKKEQIRHSNPTGMQAFILNLRKPEFSDVRVRKALAYAFDFEWTNSQLFYNAYKRCYSFFTNSELASTGLPSADELALLEPLKADIPPSVFTEAFALPVTNGDGNNRAQLREAKKLLEEAGWKVVNNQLQNNAGQVLSFEFLLYDPAFERIVNPYIKSLQRLGIQASIRKVEISQYINRMREFNFDVMVATLPQSLSPGLEQIQYWHSSTADMQASRNYAGIKNPAVDALVQQVVKAISREELVTATRALDRVLLHNWFVIPQWYIDSHRIAYWDKFAQPAIAPKYDSDFGQALFTWWIDPEKLAQLPGKVQ